MEVQAAVEQPNKRYFYGNLHCARAIMLANGVPPENLKLVDAASATDAATNAESADSTESGCTASRDYHFSGEGSEKDKKRFEREFDSRSSLRLADVPTNALDIVYSCRAYLAT
jgi:hypothetical protein